MNAPFKFFSILALLALFSAPTLVRAQDDSGDNDQDVSFQTFYDQLSDQGNWIQTDDYGYVWQPPVTDPDWRPYSEGHWVDSDEGWTWVSDEPWGWATYHYGRWANIDGTGWVWVPGYRWAPAWVSWRYGGGYAGWAPLPPDTLYGAEYGDSDDNVALFHFGGDVDVSFNIGAGCYNFVRVGDLGERNYHGRYLDRNNNYTIINHTTNITNINVDRSGFNNGNGGRRNQFAGVAAGGPPLNEVNAHAREHVARVQFTAASQPGRSTLQGNSLAIFAPSINPASVHQGRPSRVEQTIDHPNFNRGDSVTRPLAVTARLQAPPPSPAAIQAAEAAQRSAPAHAKIATEQTQVKTTFNQPLSTMLPVVQNRLPNSFPAGAGTGNATEVHHPAETSVTGETAQPDLAHPQMYQPPVHQSSQENSVTPHPESQTPNGFSPSVNHTENSQVQHETQVAPQRDHTSDAAESAPHPESQNADRFTPQVDRTENSQPQRDVVQPEHQSVQPQHEFTTPQHENAPTQHEAPSGGGGGFHPANTAPASHQAPAANNHPASVPASAPSGNGGNGNNNQHH